MDGSKMLSIVVKNLHFWIHLTICQWVSRACPNHLISHAKRGTIPSFQHCQQFGLCGLSTRTEVLCGRLYVWWGLKRKFLTIGRNYRPTAWITSMYWGRHVVLFGICFWNWSRWTRFGKPLQYCSFATRCSGQRFWNQILYLLSWEGATVWGIVSLLRLSMAGVHWSDA